MEVVDIGSLPAETVIERLLEGEALKHLAGGHGVACFALPGVAHSHAFYESLIEHSAEIDSATTEHVAFIVFYGNRSALVKRVERYRPHLERYRLEGLSTSTNAEVEVPSFDADLGEKLRFRTGTIRRPHFYHSMSDCARALLDYYAISLSVEPCLLFVNPEIPKNYCIVALDDEDPVRSLLADILAPMSQAFRGLSAYWRDMDRLRWRERELKEAQKTADSAPAEICTLNGSLKRAKSARKESERPERRMADERRIEILKGLLQAFEENWKDADLRLSEVPGAEQFSQELKGFEMSRRYCAAVEQDLSLIQADADNFRVVDKRNKLKATLRRSQNKRWTRLGQIRRQLTDETKRIQGFSEKCQQEIRWLNDQIARAQQRLEDARNLLHSQDENQDMANRTTLVNKQTAFRNEGYPEETLTSENPSAFSVIETLSRNGRVGRMQPNHATSQWRGNPSRLEALVRTRHTRNETIHLDKNMSDTTAKKILDSALTALLKGLELSPWIKVPATFISELSKRFSSLPPEEKHELAKARQDAIVSSIPAAALNGTPPQPNVLAKAIQEAVFRAILLDHLYGLTLPDLNELINRIEKARPNVSETAPRKTQVAQLVDWVESSEGPGLSELASKARF